MNREISQTANLLGSQISTLDLGAAIEACKRRVGSGLGGYVCFSNVHTVTEASVDPSFRTVLQGAFLAVADGLPLVWASRWLRQPIAGRVCGPDFMREFSVFQRQCGLVGGMDDSVGGLIANRLGLEAVVYSPPFRPFSAESAREDWSLFLSRCSGGVAPSVVWVGLGAPKQERWMQVVSGLAPKTLFFGVGAAFDFYSGRKKRAPLWMQRAGLEWLHRLIQEPRRLFWRYFSTNTRFAWAILRQRIFGARLRS